MLTKIEQFLSGKKAYGLCALGLFIWAAAKLHWIDLPEDQAKDLLQPVLFGAIAALRAGVASAGAK